MGSAGAYGVVALMVIGTVAVTFGLISSEEKAAKRRQAREARREELDQERGGPSGRR
jgi:hypothetical protein